MLNGGLTPAAVKAGAVVRFSPALERAHFLTFAVLNSRRLGNHRNHVSMVLALQSFDKSQWQIFFTAPTE